MFCSSFKARDQGPSPGGHTLFAKVSYDTGSGGIQVVRKLLGQQLPH